VPAPDRLALLRIVATPAALDSYQWSKGAIVMRVAPDEILAISSASSVRSGDPHAIELAESGFAGIWLEAAEANEFLSRWCEWELPAQRPAFAQGAVAGLPVKLWFEQDRVLILVPAPYAAELAERMS